MPIYSIMNTETEEVFEVNIKFAELETYLIDNKNHKQVFTKFPGYGDPVRLGIKKPDEGFKDVLRTVSSHHKRNIINTF
jgi:hypothetical protein